MPLLIIYAPHPRDTPHLLLADRDDLRGDPHLPGGERDGRRSRNLVADVLLPLVVSVVPHSRGLGDVWVPDDRVRELVRCGDGEAATAVSEAHFPRHGLVNAIHLPGEHHHVVCFLFGRASV